jgi:hypothetical protein
MTTILVTPEDLEVEPQVTGSYTRLTPYLSGPATYDNSRWNAINILPAASSASKAELPINPMGYVQPGHIYRVRPCWEPSAGAVATQVGTVRTYDRAALGQGELTTFLQTHVVLDAVQPVAGVPEVWFRQESGSNFGYEITRTDAAASTFRMYLYGMYVDEPAQPTFPSGRRVTESQLVLYAGAPVHDLRENYAWKLSANGMTVGFPLSSMLFNGAGSYRFRPVMRIPTGVPAHTQLATIEQHNGVSVVTSTPYYSDSVPTTYSASYVAQTDWSSAGALAPQGGTWPVLERWWNGVENVGATRIQIRWSTSTYAGWFAGWWVEWQDPTLFDCVVNTAAFGGYGYAISQWQPQPQGRYRWIPGSDSLAQGPPVECDVTFTPTLNKFGGGAGNYKITPMLMVDANRVSGNAVHVCRWDVCDTARTDQSLVPGGAYYIRGDVIPAGGFWPKANYNTFALTFPWDGVQGVQFRVLCPAWDWGTSFNPYTWLHNTTVGVGGFWIDKV